MSKDTPEYFSNIDSTVGLAEPNKKLAFVDIRSHTEVWDGNKFVLLGTRYNKATTVRNSREIQRYYNQKDLPANAKRVLILTPEDYEIAIAALKPKEKKEEKK